MKSWSKGGEDFNYQYHKKLISIFLYDEVCHNPTFITLVYHQILMVERLTEVLRSNRKFR